jgi:hypothetical protein
MHALKEKREKRIAAANNEIMLSGEPSYVVHVHAYQIASALNAISTIPKYT